jgi:hypothetical protein
MFRINNYYKGSAVLFGGAFGLLIAGILRNVFDNHPIEDPLEVAFRME